MCMDVDTDMSNTQRLNSVFAKCNQIKYLIMVFKEKFNSYAPTKHKIKGLCLAWINLYL